LRGLCGKCGYLLKEMWANKEMNKALKCFNDGMPNIIEGIIAELIAGSSLSKAIEKAAEECNKPIRKELETVLVEISLGLSLEEALVNLSNRVPSADLEILVHAVMVNKQQGGDLVEALEKVLEEIKERKAVEEMFDIYEHRGKISVGILGVIPILAVFMIYILFYEYLDSIYINFTSKALINIAFIIAIMGLVHLKKPIKLEIKAVKDK
jgi:tight adherence protein B